MPFVSKAQARKFREMEAKKELEPGTTEKWMSETQNFDALPERTKPKQPTKAKKASPPTPRDFGWYR